MKLVTFRRKDSREARAGVALEDAIIDLEASMLEVLTTGSYQDEPTGPRYPIEDVEFLAPIPRPPKLLASAGNYQEHLREGGGSAVDKSAVIPRLFIKPSNTVLAPGAPLLLPKLSHQVDWELELAVVIGVEGRIAGYTIVNDISARSIDWDVQRDIRDWDNFFDWLNGKWFDGFAPLGPWIVTADEISDPQSLELELRVNGVLHQKGSTADMIFGAEELVEFAGRLVTLEPGDVIATGTPAGVGDASATYLQAGDVLDGAISLIGSLQTPVAAQE